jgi:hypothetical protein
MSLIKQVTKLENSYNYKFNMNWDGKRNVENDPIYEAFLEIKKMFSDSDVVEFDISINNKTFKINKKDRYFSPDLEKTVRPRFFKDSPNNGACEAIPSGN